MYAISIYLTKKIERKTEFVAINIVANLSFSILDIERILWTFIKTFFVDFNEGTV